MPTTTTLMELDTTLDSVEVKARWAPMADLLGGNAITLGYSGFWGQNYAQGWLLNHYLAFEPSRKGQIDAYVKRISAGEEALHIGLAVFAVLMSLVAAFYIVFPPVIFGLMLLLRARHLL